MARLLLLLAVLIALVECSPRRPAADSRPAPAHPKRAQPRQPPDIPESGPLAQKIMYEQAKGLLRAGRASEAVPLFRRSIEAHRRGDLLPSCYLGMGSALGDLGRHGEAVQAYRKVTELRPTDPEAFRALGAGLEEAGRLAEARQSLEQALALDADQPAVYQDLASIYLREKNVEAAKQSYLRYELTRTRLILALGRSGDEEARAAAAASLGEARDEATVKALGLALTDRSAAVRLAVIHALGQQGLAAGAGPLREIQARSKDSVEKRAIEASLRAIGAAPQPVAASLPSSAANPGASATSKSAQRPGARP